MDYVLLTLSVLAVLYTVLAVLAVGIAWVQSFIAIAVLKIGTEPTKAVFEGVERTGPFRHRLSFALEEEGPQAAPAGATVAGAPGSAPQIKGRVLSLFNRYREDFAGLKPGERTTLFVSPQKPERPLALPYHRRHTFREAACYGLFCMLAPVTLGFSFGFMALTEQGLSVYEGFIVVGRTIECVAHGPCNLTEVAYDFVDALCTKNPEHPRCA